MAEAPQSQAGQVFDVVVLALCALSGPFCVFLVPVALLRTIGPLLVRSTAPKMKQAGQRWHWIQLSLLAAGCLVQGLTLLAVTDVRLNTTLGADPAKFCRIVAGQIVVPLFEGSNRLGQMAGNPARVTALRIAVEKRENVRPPTALEFRHRRFLNYGLGKT